MKEKIFKSMGWHHLSSVSETFTMNFFKALTKAETNLAAEKSDSIHEKMILTPMSTLIAAVQMLISDEKLTGNCSFNLGSNDSYVKSKSLI